MTVIPVQKWTGMNNLSVHYLPTHGRPDDIDLIRTVSNKLVKYASPGKPDVYGLQSVWNLLDPDGILLLRNVAMSNQTGDVVLDPIGTGHRHAREWLEQIQAYPYLDSNRVRIESANEIPQWGDVSPSVTNDYNVTFADDLNACGWLAMLGQINTGWPANTGTDTPSNWRPFDGMLDRLSWASNWQGLHEYFGTPGPRGLMAGWWAYRYRHLLDYCKQTGRPHPPIVINELGLAKEFQRANGSWGQNPTQGWMGNLSPEQYMSHLLDYAEDSAADGIIAATVFTTDGAKPWISSMDTHGIHDLWRAAGAQQLGIEPNHHDIPDTPVEVHVPLVTVDGPQISTGDPDDMGTEYPVQGAIDPAMLLAIVDIESDGVGLPEPGKPTIRFEAHIFRRRLQDNALFDKHFQIAAIDPWANQQWLRLTGGVLSPIHTGNQSTEYAAFRRAVDIAPVAAYESVSVGIAQIMGFNFRRIGYQSARDMWDDFSTSEAAQIVGLLNYVISDPSLVAAIRRRDWREIARRYNGAGGVDTFAPLLEAAYRERAV